MLGKVGSPALAYDARVPGDSNSAYKLLISSNNRSFK
jgi:hypothetical protein